MYICVSVSCTRKRLVNTSVYRERERERKEFAAAAAAGICIDRASYIGVPDVFFARREFLFFSFRRSIYIVCCRLELLLGVNAREGRTAVVYIAAAVLSAAVRLFRASRIDVEGFSFETDDASAKLEVFRARFGCTWY